MPRLIIATWKDTGKVEAYTTLSGFVKHNAKHEFNYNSVDYLIGRCKSIYEDHLVTVVRVPLIGKFVKPKRKKKK